MGKKLRASRLKQKFVKTNTKEEGGTMKVFGDALNPSVPYKTFLLSVSDTAEWVVKELLSKYGLKQEDPLNYCLLQITMPPYNQMDKKPFKEIILHDKECPLHIYFNHMQKNAGGSIIFKIVRCSPGYVELRKRLHAQELALRTPQIPSLQDRTVHDLRPMLLEVNHDGSDLSITRVFKIHSDATHVGQDARATIGKPYLFINGAGIDRDHCTIENQNGIVRLIPRGEVRLNGKLVSIPFALEHGAFVCFGRNSTFRYLDPQMAQKIKRIRIPQLGRPSVYSSAPVLSTKATKSSLGMTNLQPTNVSPAGAVDPGAKLDVLPGLLDVPEETESRFLHAVVADYPLENIQFRLFPAYTLYMILRYRLSPYGKPNMTFIEKQKDVRSFLYRVEDMINRKIEQCQKNSSYLAYWLANVSEFVYFLKQDRDLTKLSSDIQIHLISFIQRSAYYLLNLLQTLFDQHLIALTDLSGDIHPQKLSDTRRLTLNSSPTQSNESASEEIIASLSSLLILLRKCRVNAGLTVQIFSQVFLYINTWLFNRAVTCPELKLCTSAWGERLSLRLKSISHWAQNQGLESPCACQLMQINQLCALLKNSKRDSSDAQGLISSSAWKINSVQVNQVLNRYVLDKDEPPIADDFSQALLSAAHHYVDESLHRKGLIVQLKEAFDLDQPVLIPIDGYAFETLQGIPQQLFQFVESVSRSTLCRLFINPHSRGLWTEFMTLTKSVNKSDDRIETIVLNKGETSFGLSIVSATSDSQQYRGIYIKAIVPNSAAEKDGRLQPGDQILRVDNVNLIDMTHEKAVNILKQCGSSVTLQVLKDAAHRHGLSALLDTPSEIPHGLTRFPSPLSSSVMSYQSPPLQTANIYESLLTIHQPQPAEPASNSFTTNSNLSQMKQFTHHQDSSFEEVPFIRSSNRTQSFMTSNTPATRPILLREDVPPSQTGNDQFKSVQGSTILSKPVFRTNSFVRPTKVTNSADFPNRLSLQLRKSHEPNQLVNTYQANLNKIRLKRINGLQAKVNRTDQEEKELNNLKLEDEFCRRVETFYSQTHESTPDESRAPSFNELDEELRRRLEQFERDREIERATINRLLAKREASLQRDRMMSNIPEYDAPPDLNLAEVDRQVEQTHLPKYLLKFQ